MNERDIAMRAPDFITEPYGESFIRKYIDGNVIEAYKQTNIYQGYYEGLSAYEKQNEAVYNLIHWQIIDRNHFNDYEEQAHLLGVYDKLALIIAFVSQKASNFYLMNGFELYYTDVNSHRRSTSIILGNSYFGNLFTDNRNYNLPFDFNFLCPKTNSMR